MSGGVPAVRAFVVVSAMLLGACGGFDSSDQIGDRVPLEETRPDLVVREKEAQSTTMGTKAKLESRRVPTTEIDFIAPEDHLLSDVFEAYRQVHRALLDGLANPEEIRSAIEGWLVGEIRQVYLDIGHEDAEIGKTTVPADEPEYRVRVMSYEVITNEKIVLNSCVTDNWVQLIPRTSEVLNNKRSVREWRVQMELGDAGWQLAGMEKPVESTCAD